MRAIMKQAAAPGLVLTELPVPEPGAYEVRIKVSKVAICGTDMHIYNWDKWAAATIPHPLTIGHEFVGTIDAIGSAVSSVAIGQRVSGEGHIVCGHCRNCRAGREHCCPNTLGVGVNHPGAFADYVLIPEHNVYPIPSTLDDEIAALLDPFGNAVHTALSFDLVGEDILINGAGPIGVMAAAVCRHAGARHIVVSDLNDKRLAIAKAMGASVGCNPQKQKLSDMMSNLGMQEGFDIGLEMSGAPVALNNMLEAMNNGGQIGLLGLFSDAVAVDLNQAIMKNIKIKGVFGREMFDTWHKGLAMLETGLDIRTVISHRFAFEDFQQGFDALNRGEAMKVILNVD